MLAEPGPSRKKGRKLVFRTVAGGSLGSITGYGLVIWAVLLSLCTGLEAARVFVHANSRIPQIEFAAEEVRNALAKISGWEIERKDLNSLDTESPETRIVLATAADSSVLNRLHAAGSSLGTLEPEGYSIRRTSEGQRTCIWVIGADEGGSMYGGLELAEIIRVEGLPSIRDVDQNPHLAMRGTKFNCPLDVRTPSYSDLGDAGQQNIAEMWNFGFWKEYIDHLARYRFNFVSLWSLHPFPSLVRVPEYPAVALDDVLRSTVPWKEHYSLQGRGFDDPEILANTEVLKRMTIEEKIAFWRKVMRYGKERNVDFYIVTWNIFVYGTDGQYGITDDISNETTRDYFRKSVKQLFLTYPDLKGVGLTTGENMPGATPADKEDWAFKTYAAGVLDALREQPRRQITFIHRQHQTGAPAIAKVFQPLVDHPNVDFIFSFKYAKAHVYSSTKQTFHTDFLEEIRSAGDLKTIWTLRNDDVYHFRWGSPDFVRSFFQNIPHDRSQGFYYGSDQYIWGREFLSLDPEIPRQLEVSKHWYQWMLWGRLGYAPELQNQRLIRILQHRFPDVAAESLFKAWQDASMIYPLTTGFHWGALDFQWYIEACKSRAEPAQTASGFHDVNRFITLAPHPATDNISIPDFVDGKVRPGKTPLAVSSELHNRSDSALRILRTLRGDGRELEQTLRDIRAMAFLGKYYAHKIHGATELALYRHNRRTEHQKAAVRELKKAVQYWDLYTKTAAGSYRNPLWLNRVGHVNWRDLAKEVRKDVQIAAGR